MAKDTITIPRLATAPKPKRKKPTKKKAAKVPPKPEYVNVNAIQFGYNAMVNNALRADTLFGEQIPNDLEGQVEFWKKKYEQSLNQASKLTSQVTLLQSIIDKALTRSCSGSC